MENKNSFFSILLRLDGIENNSYYRELLENKIDLVLGRMQGSTNIHRFDQRGGDQMIYYFQVNQRKRRGQLVKACEEFLPETQEYKVSAITKSVLEDQLIRLKQNPNFTEVLKPDLFSGYTGRDIEKFDYPKNWYTWEKIIYNQLFESRDISTSSIKPADERIITQLYDPVGNSGKSQFFKFLTVRRLNDIGRISYGTTSQLKSSMINIGPKPIWIIDLPRSKTYRGQAEQELLSALEDLKSGVVLNQMYGSGKAMMFDPPHVIISSNFLMNQNSLSADRWDIKKITEDKNLISIPNPKKYMESDLYKREQKQNSPKLKEKLGKY